MNIQHWPEHYWLHRFPPFQFLLTLLRWAGMVAVGMDDRCLWHDLRAMMSIRYRGLFHQATGKCIHAELPRGLLRGA